MWAFAGIVVKQSNEPLVATTAGAMAGVVVLVLLWSLFGNRLARPRLRTGAV